MKGSYVARELPADQLEVECTHCGIPMAERRGEESRIRYFHCPSCRRCFSSVYSEIFRTDAKVRIQRIPLTSPGRGFETAKERLEQWLNGLDSQDPYLALGVSPRDSTETIRNRYKQLALERHPDRGGSAESMKQINVAYDRVTRHCEDSPSSSRSRSESVSSVLPPRKR